MLLWKSKNDDVIINADLISLITKTIPT